MKTLPLAALLLAGCQAVVGSGVSVTSTREVPAFRKVAVGSAVHATITTGSRSVVVRADDNLLPLLETFVEGDTLVVRLQPLTLLGFHGPLEATISNDLIEGLDASGASTIVSALTPVPTLHVTASGASRVTAGPVSSTSVVAEASGVSQVSLSGAAMGATATASGASGIDLRGVPLESATIDVSGASAFTGRVSAALAGSVSGASTATIIGTPASTVVVSGASHLGTGAR